ncbi:PAS domain S-box-containing protein [Desulfacinum hydrothermale DSM 13146]|uniref:histidine kinase n=1 Tax=Desulfacinum hydrothermale DSM 13146 TaxID=1121390 RepID=A0A1W1XHS8_9BACT|nr:ATP-binding protein [Desulfacinum hydrothermale]SMC23510.1 PAS domain S-box-containing protein [Desulfacinum hydrothermale DSM 13146]
MEEASQRPMKIAVIGGGKRCRAFLEMMDARRFPRLKAQIVAVADPDDSAEGVRLARAMGIETTADYRDFYKIPDLDLVIEFTGNEELLEDFLRHSPAKVRVLEAAISRLFGDLIRFQEEYLFRERQLELIEGIADSIFSSIRDRVLIMRPDRKILDANDAFLEWVGMDKDDVIGAFCHQITHRSLTPCAENGLHCPLDECLQSGGTGHAIHEHYGHGNAVRYCEITTVPLKNRKGSVELVLEVLRDITDELEQKLEQKTRALKRDLARLIHEDKMIALGKLVASAVHEINNPLSGIHALARLMSRQLEQGLSPEDLEQFKYYLNLIDTESARCSAIVGNLLSFSRQQKLEKRLFQLNEVVHRVVLLSQHKMELQHIELVLDLQEDLPEMEGDPGQIQQCVINLLFNAMEAMPEGGRLSVRTIHDRDRGEVRLEVADTGVGIPQEKMSQIFEPFYSTKSQDKGVGLGLSVVYGIVKEHRGTIYVKSRVGEGACFMVRFPCQKDTGRE